MDTGGPLQCLIKNPKLVSQEKATQNLAVHPHPHLCKSIKWVWASPLSSCQASDKEWACSHIHILMVFQRSYNPVTTQVKFEPSFFRVFKSSSNLPSYLISVWIPMRSKNEFLALRNRPSMCYNRYIKE